MDRQLVKSKMRTERSFPNPDGYRIVLNACDKNGKGGKTWVTKDDVDYLLKTSTPFNDFIRKKLLVIKSGENSVREENAEEKEQRLSLIEKARAMAQRVMPDKKPDSELANTSSELEDFTKSLKTESEKELSLFGDALRNASVEQEKINAESIGNAINAALKQFATDIDQLTKDKTTAALNQFAVDIDQLNKSKMIAALKQLTTDVDKMLKNRLSAFEKVIKAAVEDAKKQIKS